MKPTDRQMPRSIMVGPTRFKVTPVENLQVIASDLIESPYRTNESEFVHEHDTIDVLGVTNSDEQLILIESTGIGPDVQATTFIHESLHAVMANAGMRDLLTDAEEESVVKRLSPILLQFLRQNPRVYTYLTGRSVS